VTASDKLLIFNSQSPGTIQAAVPITGLQGGETIRAVDARPATGQLYGLGSSGRLYTINPSTGAATQVGTGTFAVPLSGASFDIDFDPVTGLLRVISDAGQNLRVDPDTGAVVDADPGTPGVQPDSFLSSTYIVGAAYSDNLAGAATTTLYGIDGANGRLVVQGGPGGNPSPSLGQITAIGQLGVQPDWAPVPAAPFRHQRRRDRVHGPTGRRQDVAVRRRPLHRGGHGGWGDRRRHRPHRRPHRRDGARDVDRGRQQHRAGERRRLPGPGPLHRLATGGDRRLHHGRRHRGRRPGLRGHPWHPRLPAR
jgi:hypothetical protein